MTRKTFSDLVSDLVSEEDLEKDGGTSNGEIEFDSQDENNHMVIEHHLNAKKKRQSFTLLKKSDPEAHFKRLRWIYQQMKETARNMYFFCFMDNIGLNGFCRKVERYRMFDRFTGQDHYAKWLFGHEEVLKRTFPYIQDLMDWNQFTYFMYRHSSECQCYEIERDDKNYRDDEVTRGDKR